MTLAAILSLCMFCSGPATVKAALWNQSSQQPAEVKPTEIKLPEDKPADPSTASGQSDSGASQTQSPAAPKNATPSDSPAAPQKPVTPARRKRHGTAKRATPCQIAADTKMATGNSAASSSAPAAVPAPCAPPKIVVRNGGTTEATVQLTGGSAAATNSPQRANIDRLLGSIEESIKKIGGRQLDSSQQETVKQVREYAAQSRAALDAGDLELAHNLALKAHLLADQLLKPKP